MPTRTIYLTSTDIWDELTARAKREGTSVSALILKACRLYLAESS